MGAWPICDLPSKKQEQMPVEDPKTIDHDQHLFDLLILTRVFQMRQGWFGTCCAAGDSETTFGLQQFILAEGALFGAEGALFASTAKTSASP